MNQALPSLLEALRTIQASGVTASYLATRTGLSYATCCKLLSDKRGQWGYHWSTIEFALRGVGCELSTVAVKEEFQYSRRYVRQISGRRMRNESRA